MGKLNKNNDISFLKFQVGKEMFATKSNEVLSILDTNKELKIKNNDNSIRIYGQSIPFYFASEKLGLSKIKCNEKSCIIILKINRQNKKVGFIVDEVKSLIEINEGDIKELPKLGNRYKSKGIDKFFVIAGQIIRVIDFKELIDDNLSNSNIAYTSVANVNVINY